MGKKCNYEAMKQFMTNKGTFELLRKPARKENVLTRNVCKDQLSTLCMYLYKINKELGK